MIYLIEKLVFNSAKNLINKETILEVDCTKEELMTIIIPKCKILAHIANKYNNVLANDCQTKYVITQKEDIDIKTIINKLNNIITDNIKDYNGYVSLLNHAIKDVNKRHDKVEKYNLYKQINIIELNTFIPQDIERYIFDNCIIITLK